MEIINPTTQDVENSINTILRYIGEDPKREGLQETPSRIIRMFGEIFRGYKEKEKPKITTFENSLNSEEMIYDSGNFYSMCEHHILPFYGTYVVSYIPKKDGRIIGLSKIARIVDYCSAKLQLQERLSEEIADMLEEAIGENNGIAVYMQGEHLCKTMRGVKKKGLMRSFHFRGKFKTDLQSRQEFLSNIRSIT